VKIIHMKRVVVASDSFKGCLSSLQVADAVEAGVKSVCPSCEVVKLAVADGGEGTVQALSDAMNGEIVSILVKDPLGREVSASYAMIREKETAVIEVSAASGLTLLSPQERNPLAASSYGSGQIISDALSRGCRNFLMCIGGSAVNDAGMGMLSALGFRFLDEEGNRLEGSGADMSEVCDVDLSQVDPALGEAVFTVACDVDSPFCGTQGAAYVFAPQKGASPEQVKILDEGMSHFASVMKKLTGIDVINIPGAGAAGGIGGAMASFLGAELKSGAEMVLDAVRFDEVLSDTDMVITGEGCLDGQTMTGKLPYCVAQRSTKADVPVAAVCGRAEVDECQYFGAIIPVTPAAMPLNEAMIPSVASENIKKAVASFLHDRLHI
jgi:glycerate kinase